MMMPTISELIQPQLVDVCVYVYDVRKQVYYNTLCTYSMIHLTVFNKLVPLEQIANPKRAIINLQRDGRGRILKEDF